MKNTGLTIERGRGRGGDSASDAKSESTLTLNGRLDTLTSPLLRDALKDMDAGTEPVVLDFSGVSYVSSSGLRELLLALKKLGENGLRLENVSADVDELLKTTGFADFFNYTLASEEGQDDDIQAMSLNDLLERKVREHGGEIALKAGGTAYTWRDIDRGASLVASELYVLGVRSRMHVALCGANSVNWILTFYAIQKLGAIAVLLNPQLTLSEIASCSHIGDIAHLCCGKIAAAKDMKEFTAQITDPKKSLIRTVFDIRDTVDFMGKAPQYCPNLGKPVLSEKGVTDGWNTTPPAPQLALSHACLPDDVCVMIFTSGSTGTPKGVLLSAYNLLNSANYCVENLRMNGEDKMCAILPMFHIFGLTAALLASAIIGAPLVLPQSAKPDELMRVISGEKCTILHSVPTVLLRLVNAPGFSPELMSSLRASYLSGAPVSEAQLAMLMEKFPNNHFVRRYGLSEMTPVTATGYDDDMEHTLKTVGKPVEGAEIRIADRETGKELPLGEIGEVLVKGRNMMCGYYKLPAEKQPFDSDGFLRTGDLGFLDGDGYLHFSGRAKELIIRGGENIMPDEVASAISAHESVAEVKVMGVPDEMYGESVAAAVVMRDGTAFDETAMREFLMTRLAKYKIPSLFFVYDRLPTLANGKVDAVSLKKEIIGKLIS